MTCDTNAICASVLTFVPSHYFVMCYEPDGHEGPHKGAPFMWEAFEATAPDSVRERAVGTLLHVIESGHNEAS